MKIGTTLRNNFITGLIVVLPVVLTVLVIQWLVVRTTAFVDPFIPDVERALGNGVLVFPVLRGVVLVLVFSLICLVGVAARILLVRNVVSHVEQMLTRVPFVGKVYSAIKQISQAFLGGNRASFRQVVLVEYPRHGIYSVAFVTSDAGGETQAVTNQELVNVFLPTTPNPTSGLLLLVPKADLIPMQMTIEEGMKLVVSAGKLVPPFSPRADRPSAGA